MVAVSAPPTAWHPPEEGHEMPISTPPASVAVPVTMVHVPAEKCSMSGCVDAWLPSSPLPCSTGNPIPGVSPTAQHSS